MIFCYITKSIIQTKSNKMESQLIMKYQVRTNYAFAETKEGKWDFENKADAEELYNSTIATKKYEVVVLTSTMDSEDGDQVESYKVIQEYKKEESVKCEHKFPCGCDKMRCEECEEYWLENDDDRGVECEDEDCCEYYRYRNDNCNCGGCGYCSGEGYAEAEAEEEDIECVRCNEMCGVDDIVCCDGCCAWLCYDCEELQTIENDNDDNRAYCQHCWNQKKKE